MDNFVKNLFFLSENIEGIKFNPDIFESNIINLAILIALVGYFAVGSIFPAINERQQTILDSIKNTEKRLFEANSRFYEIWLQCLQADVVLQTLENQANEQIASLVESKNAKIVNTLTKDYLATLLVIKYKREQPKLQLTSLLVNLSLEEVNNLFKKLVANKKFQENYTNFSILALQNIIGDKKYE